MFQGAIELTLESNRTLAEEALAGKRVIRENVPIDRGMKRRDLVRHLEAHGCELLREGASRQPFRGHAEINDFTARNSS